MRYVSVGPRFAAALVDTLIGFVGFGFAVAAVTGGITSTPEGVSFILEGGPALALFALWLGYHVVTEATLGATVGKLVVGLRVRTADGGRIGWGAALVRNLLRVVDVCGAAVGAILIWNSRSRQRLGDRLSGTVVVRSAPGHGRPPREFARHEAGGLPAGAVAVRP
jgi:uncharacterized RDD family membrane protein YckC